MPEGGGGREQVTPLPPSAPPKLHGGGGTGGGRAGSWLRCPGGWSVPCPPRLLGGAPAGPCGAAGAGWCWSHTGARRCPGPAAPAGSRAELRWGPGAGAPPRLRAELCCRRAQAGGPSPPPREGDSGRAAAGILCTGLRPAGFRGAKPLCVHTPPPLSCTGHEGLAHLAWGGGFGLGLSKPETRPVRTHNWELPPLPHRDVAFPPHRQCRG